MKGVRYVKRSLVKILEENRAYFSKSLRTIVPVVLHIMEGIIQCCTQANRPCSQYEGKVASKAKVTYISSVR